MSRLALTALLCLAPVVTLAAGPQQRVEPKQAADFPTALDGARQSWEAKRYGTCIGQLQNALSLATEERRKAILAALPAAPEGYEIVPERKSDAAARNNPFAAAMTAAVGNVIEREYRDPNGKNRFQITLTIDSPVVGMFSMFATNPNMMEEGSELITYGTHSAILKTKGDARNLQILVSSKHICEVDARGVSEERLFAVFDQKAVDRLAAALSE